VRLTQDDIPDATWPDPIVSKNLKNDLQRWLECRGLNQQGTVDVLVKRYRTYDLIAVPVCLESPCNCYYINVRRVHSCISMGKAHKLDPKIDGGKWYQLKQRQVEAQVRIHFWIRNTSLTVRAATNSFSSFFIVNR